MVNGHHWHHTASSTSKPMPDLSYCVLQGLLENIAVNSQVDFNKCYAARPSCLEDDLATEVNTDHIMTRDL